MASFPGEKPTDHNLLRCEQFRLFEDREATGPRPRPGGLILQVSGGVAVALDKNICHTLAWTLLQWSSANPRESQQ